MSREEVGNEMAYHGMIVLECPVEEGLGKLEGNVTFRAEQAENLVAREILMKTMMEWS